MSIVHSASLLPHRTPGDIHRVPLTEGVQWLERGETSPVPLGEHRVILTREGAGRQRRKIQQLLTTISIMYSRIWGEELPF